MDMPDHSSPAPAANEELRERCASLQQQINSLLFALLLVSGTFSIYLYVQDRLTSRELQAIKGPATQMMQSFDQTEKPRIEAFVSKLVEYGKTHPDFAPIIEKYKMSVASTNTAPK
jgi:hypothetical protein